MENIEREIMPVDNVKGFKVINDVPRKVLETATGAEKCICDECLSSPDTGYYVAVLNRWFCPTCYKHWMACARRYGEDAAIEERNYNFYMKLLKKWE